MRRQSLLVTAVALASLAAATQAAAQAAAPTPDPDPAQAAAQTLDPEAAARRSLARQIPIGATLKLTTRDGQRFKAVLFGVDADGIVVKPATRIPVPAVRIPFDRLDGMQRDEGRLHLGKYAGIGAAIGGGALLAVFLGLGG